MKVIESTGKDIEQALLAGLKELDCKLDDVEVKILAHPGIFAKARVQLTVADDKSAGPAASEIMRDLERRAKVARDDKYGGRRDRSRDNRDSRDNDRRTPAGHNDRTADDRRNKQPAAAQQKTEIRQEQQRHAQQPAARERAPQPDPRERISAARPARKEEQSRNNKPAEAAAGAFRKDFRAELEAAAAGKPAETAESKPASQPQPAKDKPAHVAAAHREVPAAVVDSVSEYLRKVVSLMGIESDIAVSAADGEINAEIKTEDALVIGRRGETLDALEYLATLTTADGDKYIHVNLDCGEYRARRNENIRAIAYAAADKAVATNRRVELEPMNSATRREVHAALGGREDVITRSEGREPNRYVVVMPKNRGGQNGRSGNRHDRRSRKHRAPGGRPSGN